MGAKKYLSWFPKDSSGLLLVHCSYGTEVRKGHSRQENTKWMLRRTKSARNSHLGELFYSPCNHRITGSDQEIDKDVPNDKDFAHLSSTHTSTTLNSMWNNIPLAGMLGFDSYFRKAVTWSQFLFHTFLSFMTYKFKVKRILQNLQKLKFSWMTKNPLQLWRLLCVFSKKPQQTPPKRENKSLKFWTTNLRILLPKWNTKFFL